MSGGAAIHTACRTDSGISGEATRRDTPGSGHSRRQTIGTVRLAGGWQTSARASFSSARRARCRSRTDPGVPVRTRNECPDAAGRASARSGPGAGGSASRCTRPRYPEGLRAWLSQRRTQRGERDRGAVPLDAAQRSARADAGAPVVRRARCAAACAPDAGERFTRRVAVESAQAERGSRGSCSSRRRLDRHRRRASHRTGREANLVVFHRDAATPSQRSTAK